MLLLGGIEGKVGISRLVVVADADGPPCTPFLGGIPWHIHLTFASIAPSTSLAERGDSSVSRTCTILGNDTVPALMCSSR